VSAPARRFLIPEVLQSSQMDCGPAALAALLDGFGIRIRYDTLRQRCQTDVDGTSIDALAALGREFGLESHELLVPRDHFLLPEARCLPAIVVTRSAGGALHFVVVWRRLGPFVQILDPASGRRWVRAGDILAMMPDLPIPLSKERWRRWATSDNAWRPWLARLGRLGIGEARGRALLERAALDVSWRAFARLDAAVRMITRLIESGAIARGRSARALLDATLASSDGVSRPSLEVPDRFHWVGGENPRTGKLTVRGGVVVHFSGPLASVSDLARAALGPARAVDSSAANAAAHPPPRPWSDPALHRAIEEKLAAPQLEPMAVLWKLVRFELGSQTWLLGCALMANALVVVLEALLARGLLELDRKLSFEYQRVVSLATVLILIAIGLWLDAAWNTSIRGLGRRLETRLRVAFLQQLPRLEDHYLTSRPSSDLAARGQSLHLLREVPALWAQGARAMTTLLATLLALLYIYPGGALPVLMLTATSLILPHAARRRLAEANVRLRTHMTALQRFHLDALIGVIPVRVHGAERAVRTEHEELMTEWGRTAQALRRETAALDGVQLVATTALAAGVVVTYVLQHGEAASLLLVAFWALRVPSLALELATAQQGLRALRAVALRVVAALAAPTVPAVLATATDAGKAMAPAPVADASATDAPRAGGVAIRLDGVRVDAGGHAILQEISLAIPASRHVAIVGASGSGKSSLLGLFLGWFTPAVGSVSIDGAPIVLPRLRQELAWVDPGAQLWARSLFDNLTFGNPDAARLPQALSTADLLEVLEHLPEGLQSDLGECGLRLSAGQGQRVRLGRALMRSEARLVLLDEPFRGLEGGRRRALLERVRRHWAHATVLFVSHDIEDTLDFERVLVFDRGRLIEDGPPRVLAASQGPYATLLGEARALGAELWSADHWLKRSLERGRLSSPPLQAAEEAPRP
jgi:ABC-type bacteriocin/lantibiotic exporter with double-glycine peptidase domain